MLFIGGFGILLFFRNLTGNNVVNLVTAFFVGIIVNYLLFIGLSFVRISTSFSPYLLLVLGLTLIFVKSSKVKRIVKSIKLHFDTKLFFLIILIIFSMFIFSDKLTFTDEGVYVQDPRHPTTELSFAQSLNSMFPVNYLSYQGKEFKYHFGFGIIAYQLIHDFNQDALNLVYITFPAFFLIFIFLLLYEYSKSLGTSRGRLFFCWTVLFSTLSIPLKTLTEITNIIFKTSLPSVENPFFLVAQFIKMGSFGLAITMAVILFIYLNKDKRNYWMEMILLTGLAITKVTFFIAIGGGYTIFYVLQFFKERKFSKLICRGFIMVPGATYVLFFVLGAHKHNLWIPFINTLNASSTSLNSNFLIPNAILSLSLALFVNLGIGLFYLLPKFKELLFRKRFTEYIKSDNKHLLFIFIITVSYFLGIFLVEITEGNQDQFLFPGYIFLTLLTYTYVFRKDNQAGSGQRNPRKRKFLVLFVVCLVIVNGIALSAFFFVPTNKLPYAVDENKNNPLAMSKINFVKSVTDKKFPSNYDCLYSHDLVNALNALAKEPEGVFLMDVRHQNCENYNATSWREIMVAKNGGFIRTAVSGKQTIAEGYNFKGVLVEKDYCQRTFDNWLFYDTVTGRQDEFKDSLLLVENSDFPKYEDFSYHDYFYHFSEKNLYTYNEEFNACITEKINNAPDKVRIIWLENFLVENNISYILVERRPILPFYVKALGLEEIYQSSKVQLFKV